MYRPTLQHGLLTILYGCGSNPLQFWAKKTNYGHVKRIVDDDLHSLVVEVEGTNVSTTYITCPGDPKKVLGIKLPFLTLVVKNLKKYFSFEIRILDHKNTRRRIRASNYQTLMRVQPFACTMPMQLDDGWNQIQFNLIDFCQETYGTKYVETLSVQIHANCRVRRVYFSERLYTDAELPDEFKLYLPTYKKPKLTINKPGEKKAQNIPPQEAASDPQDQPPSDEPPEGESETPEEGEPEE